MRSQALCSVTRCHELGMASGCPEQSQVSSGTEQGLNANCLFSPCMTEFITIAPTANCGRVWRTNSASRAPIASCVYEKSDGKEWAALPPDHRESSRRPKKDQANQGRRRRRSSPDPEIRVYILFGDILRYMAQLPVHKRPRAARVIIDRLQTFLA